MPELFPWDFLTRCPRFVPLGLPCPRRYLPSATVEYAVILGDNKHHGEMVLLDGTK